MISGPIGTRRALCAVLALGALSACQRGVDLDMRGLGDGFTTSDAALGATSAPATAAPLSAMPGAVPAAQPGFQPVTVATASASPAAASVTTTALSPTAAPVAPTPALAPVAAPLAAPAAAQVAAPTLAAAPAPAAPAPVAPLAGTTTLPGAGSPTPVPPSASQPLPADEPPAPPPSAAPDPAPVPQDLGEQQTAEPTDGELAMPASGSIIRAYAPGRNEGIDIGAPAGSEVRAADSGTVAAVTTNTDGVQIVVIKHPNDLLTVYTHLENLTVSKDATVSRGQVIGEVRSGDPSFLHFEVRRGMTSQDPAEFLP